MRWISVVASLAVGAIGRPRFPVRFGWPDAAVLLLVVWHTVAAPGATQDGAWLLGRSICFGSGSAWGCAFPLTRQFLATRAKPAMVAERLAWPWPWPATVFWTNAPGRCHRRGCNTRPIPTGPCGAAGLWFSARFAAANFLEPTGKTRSRWPPSCSPTRWPRFCTPWLAMLAGMVLSARRNRKRLLGIGLCRFRSPRVWCSPRAAARYIASGGWLALVCGRERRFRIGWKLPVAARSAWPRLMSPPPWRSKGRTVLRNAWKSFARSRVRSTAVDAGRRIPIVRSWAAGSSNFQNAYTQDKLPQAAEEAAIYNIPAAGKLPPRLACPALALVAVLGCFLRDGDCRRDGKGGTGKENRSGQPAGRAVNPKSRIGNFKFQIAILKFAIDSPIPNPSTEIPHPSTDAWAHTCSLAGAAGFLLSVPLGHRARAAGSRLP